MYDHWAYAAHKAFSYKLESVFITAIDLGAGATGHSTIGAPPA